MRDNCAQTYIHSQTGQTENLPFWKSLNKQQETLNRRITYNQEEKRPNNYKD